MLDLKRCIFCVHFGIFVRNVVCEQGLIVDAVKIVFTVNLESPSNVTQLHRTLGDNGYYIIFIKANAQITTLMEKLLMRDTMFCWNEEC